MGFTSQSGEIWQNKQAMRGIKQGLNRPRLLVITGEFPAVTTTFVTNELAAAIALGWKVHVLATREGTSEGWQLANSLGLKRDIVTYNDWHTASRFALRSACWLPRVGLAANRLAFGRMSSLRRRTFFASLLCNPAIVSADLIHAHWTQWAFEIGLPIGLMLGVPVTCTVHDSFLSTQDEAILAELQNKLQGISMVSRFNFDIWNSRINNINNSNMRVIYNGIDIRRFPPRSFFRKTGEMPIIITIGRCHPQKRQADLVLAVSELRSRGVNVGCVIVGGGSELPTLRRLAKEQNVADRIRFLGAQPQRVVIEELYRADMFALMSSHESFGVVTAESMAAYLPTVVSRAGGSVELVEENVTGFTFPIGDIHSLANQLGKLILDAELRQQMGVAGRVRVEEKFSLTVHMQEMEKLWNQALTWGPRREQEIADYSVK